MDQNFKTIFWLVGVAVTLTSLILLKDVIFPFIAGMAVAYFFDPIADKLEAKKMPRTVAALFVLLLFFLVLLGFLILLVPALQSELSDLVKLLPRFLVFIQDSFALVLDELKYDASPESLANVGSFIGQFAGKGIKWFTGLLGNLWSGGLALFNIVSLILITPIVAFYLLRDWDLITSKIDFWLPRDAAPVIRLQLKLIDSTIAGFARGQASVCIVLSLFYALSLTLVGLQSGLLIGITAGFISFVPYIGAAVGLIVGGGVAFFQFPNFTPIILVFSIFLVGQLLESYFLTPRLVGDRVGLHPVWIIFALLAGGTLFGFVGILLAVPIAAIIGVLARFFISRYLESSLYLGKNKN